MAPEDLEKMADSAIAGAGGPVVDVDVEEDAARERARGARSTRCSSWPRPCRSSPAP